MSVGCWFVTCVLKQDHCSLTASSCLSFANELPSVTIESFISSPLPAGTWALSLPGISCSSVCPSSLISPTSMWPESWVLPPALFDTTPSTSVCAAWPAQGQRSSGENAQPRFLGALYIPVWPLMNGKQLCHAHESQFMPCILTPRQLRVTERLPLPSREASVEAKKVQISTGRMNPHRLKRSLSSFHSSSPAGTSFILDLLTAVPKSREQRWDLNNPSLSHSTEPRVCFGPHSSHHPELQRSTPLPPRPPPHGPIRA